MPDGRPQHHISWADGLVVLEGNTVSLNGALKEDTGDTTPKRGIPPILPPHHAWTSDKAAYVNQARHDRADLTLMLVIGRFVGT
jgi:hypothetical protein